MQKFQNIAFLITGLTLVGSIVLVIDRGGLIGWSVLLLAAALLTKILYKPSKLDLRLSLGIVAVALLAWIGTLFYVISTYESGEVVELDINTEKGTHLARLWVFEIGINPVVYYDAEPEAAAALLAGQPLQFTRADTTSTRHPKATLVDALPEEESRLVFEAMATKYGSRMTAADIYYVVLGRPRDRIAMVVELQ